MARKQAQQPTEAQIISYINSLIKKTNYSEYIKLKKDNQCFTVWFRVSPMLCGNNNTWNPQFQTYYLNEAIEFLEINVFGQRVM